VKLVREDYYELYSEGELLDDGFASFGRSLSSPAAGELEVRLPFPLDTEPTSLSEVRLGREWKIDSFAEVTGSEEPSAP